IGPQSSALTTQLTYEVQLGHLFRLPVRLPPGWAVEQVQLSPPGLLRGWNVFATAGGEATVVPDLQQAVGPPNLARRTVRRKPPAEASRTDIASSRPVELAFPDPMPEGGPAREGALAISVDPAFDSVAQSPVEPGVREPTIGFDPRTVKPWG